MSSRRDLARASSEVSTRIGALRLKATGARKQQNKGYISHADVLAVRPDLDPSDFFSYFETQSAESVLLTRSHTTANMVSSAAMGVERPDKPDSDIIRFSDFTNGLRVSAEPTLYQSLPRSSTNTLPEFFTPRTAWTPLTACCLSRGDPCGPSRPPLRNACVWGAENV